MRRRLGAIDPGGGGRVTVAVVAACFSAPMIVWTGGPAMVVAAGRMLAAFALSLPAALVVWRQGGPRALGIDATVALPLAVATLMLALHFAAWTVSVDTTSVASAVVLVNAHPLVVLGVEAVLWRQVVRRRQWLGAGVALAGLAFLGGADAILRGPRALLGDGLALAGAVTYAIYVLASARVRVKVPTDVQVAVLYGGSLLILGLGTLVTRSPWPAPWLGPRLWLGFLLLGLVPTMLGHTMVQSVLDRVRPGVVSVALLGEPVGASLLAWAVLHQRPAPTDVIGGAVALIGIAIALWPEGEPPVAALAT